jgi:hypothetical protein
MLAGLDVVVIDLQYIGARIYTFIYTMANCLSACGRHGVPVIVCDRPNPIGGIVVEGETLVGGFESFVGLFPIPMRHGLTIGELAAVAARVAPENENVGPRLAEQHLSRYGIKVENGALYVANRSDALAKGLAGKGLLGANWHNLLSRIDGAEKTAPMWFAAGITQRAVKVPLKYVLQESNAPF